MGFLLLFVCLIKRDTREMTMTDVEILISSIRHHAGEPGSMEQWQTMGPGREWARESWEAV